MSDHWHNIKGDAKSFLQRIAAQHGTPTAAKDAPSAAAGHTEKPPLRVKIVPPGSTDQPYVSSPIDVIDPTKPRESNKTPTPQAEGLQPFRPPPSARQPVIEDFTSTSRSANEAFYKHGLARGIDASSGSHVNLDAGLALLSTSYVPPKGSNGFGRVRPPTPDTYERHPTRAFGGLGDSKYSTMSTDTSTRNSSTGYTTPMFGMSPLNSVMAMGRASHSHKRTHEERQAARQAKEAQTDKGILERKMRSMKVSWLLPKSESSTPGSVSRSASPSPTLPTSTTNAAPSAIYAPQPISPVLNRTSLLTEALKAGEKPNDDFAALPRPAVAPVGMAGTTPSMPSQSNAGPSSSLPGPEYGASFNYSTNSGLPRARSVILRNLPPYMRARKLPGLVWGGAIDRFEYNDQEPTAIVKFVDPEAARIFYWRTTNGIPRFDNPNLYITVHMCTEIEPLSTRLRQSLAMRNASRVVRIVGYPEYEPVGSAWELGEWGVNGKGGSDLLVMRDLVEIRDGRSGGSEMLRTVQFHFLSMRDADEFYLEVSAARPYRHLEVEFVEDPCKAATGVREIA